MRRTDREITDIREIEEIIRKSDVCRIALAVDNFPYMVTMNFGYSGSGSREIFFHCAGTGKKLDMISKNNLVCFEFDTDHKLYGGQKGCDWGMKFRSVVGYGNIEVITDHDEKIKAFDVIMDHYAPGRKFIFDTDTVTEAKILKLTISEITGKKL
jgi:nitroimidazol reductase NimA-like FMN-containing flavoprotein (pyridoxamine 5'-phosphate oxidase superfamily)